MFDMLMVSYINIKILSLDCIFINMHRGACVEVFGPLTFWTTKDLIKMYKNNFADLNSQL